MPGPDGVYDLLVDGKLAARATVGGGNRLSLDIVSGRSDLAPGSPGTARFDGLPAGRKEVELWLPQGEIVELIALRADAAVEPPAPGTGARWVHHGSSISHGSPGADSPTGTWPAIAAALGGVRLLNLGLGGQAVLDPFTARAIRDAPADLISVKVGINIVNFDLFRLRAFGPAVHGFLDTIRDGHPDTPLLVVSPILCPMLETVPGPTVPDPDAPGRLRPLGDPAEVAAGKLNLTVIRGELQRIVGERGATDANLHYLDGRQLYGAEDAIELPLPDGLHPGAAGQRRIGERFAGLAFGPSGPLARPAIGWGAGQMGS